jgi:regulator of Ty1 transposition protein 109
MDLHYTVGEQGANMGGLVLNWTLPGYSEGEAKGMIGSGKALPAGVPAWGYKPPFSSPFFDSAQDLAPQPVESQEETSTQLAAERETRPLNLATMIPSLPDDPISRFLDEIVNDDNDSSDTLTKPNTIPIPPHIRSQHPKPDNSLDSNSESQIGKPPLTHLPPSPAKSRQNDVEVDAEVRVRKTSQAILAGVNIGEFWERMGFRQECCSGDVTGFFEVSYLAQTPSRRRDEHQAEALSLMETEVPTSIVDRLHTALSNCDFQTLDLAMEGSGIWLRSVRAILEDEIGREGYEGCIGVVEVKSGLGQVEVKRKVDEVVTILLPRKKKKV